MDQESSQRVTEQRPRCLLCYKSLGRSSKEESAKKMTILAFKMRKSKTIPKFKVILTLRVMTKDLEGTNRSMYQHLYPRPRAQLYNEIRLVLAQVKRLLLLNLFRQVCLDKSPCLRWTVLEAPQDLPSRHQQWRPKVELRRNQLAQTLRWRIMRTCKTCSCQVWNSKRCKPWIATTIKLKKLKHKHKLKRLQLNILVYQSSLARLIRQLRVMSVAKVGRSMMNWRSFLTIQTMTLSLLTQRDLAALSILEGAAFKERVKKKTTRLLENSLKKVIKTNPREVGGVFLARSGPHRAKIVVIRIRWPSQLSHQKENMFSFRSLIS